MNSFAALPIDIVKAFFGANYNHEKKMAKRSLMCVKWASLLLCFEALLYLEKKWVSLLYRCALNMKDSSRHSVLGMRATFFVCCLCVHASKNIL
jgi:hypothetical protein